MLLGQYQKCGHCVFRLRRGNRKIDVRVTFELVGFAFPSIHTLTQTFSQHLWITYPVQSILLYESEI